MSQLETGTTHKHDRAKRQSDSIVHSYTEKRKGKNERAAKRELGS